MNQDKSKALGINFIINSIAQVLNIILGFIVRRIFIEILGNEILGLNSLYSNVVGLLTISELGIGTAVTVFLYEPLAKNDYKLVAAYMNFLRKLYWIIGIFIIGIGVMISPIIHIFVTADISNIYVTYSFVLYVISTGISYFFSYKKILLEADLKAYILSVLQVGYKIVLNLGYILILVLTKNYYLYICVSIVCNFSDNFIASQICNKKYYWLKINSKRKLDRDLVRSLVLKVKAMLCHRIGSSLIEGADNIIISTFLSTVMVAYYSNYRLITNMLNAVVGCLGNSTMPAFGNIIHTDSSHVKRTFSRLMLLQHYLYSITCVCFVVVGTDFVTFMFGSDSGLPISVVALIAAVYYIRGFSYAIESLRGAYGAYEKDQYWSLFGALVNIVISIVGVLNIGLNGVLVGTVFAYTLKYIILIPRIVFNSCMNDNRKWYYERLVKYILITIFESILALLICRYINLNNVYVNFLLKGLTSAIVSFACTSIIFVNSDEQRELLKTGKRLLSRM